MIPALLAAIAVMSYLLGGLNGAIIASKYVFHRDVRDYGSGLTNFYRTFGAPGLAIVIGTDVLKTVIAVVAGGLIMGTQGAAATGQVFAGFCVMLGHIYPVFYGFRGGKGLACLAGGLLSFDWRLFLVFLGAEAVIVLVTDYICFVPMTASVAFTAVYAVLTKNALGTLAFTVATLAILFRHLDNLKRIKSGDEAHFSLLWKRQEEVKRIGLEEEDRKWQARNKHK